MSAARAKRSGPRARRRQAGRAGSSMEKTAFRWSNPCSLLVGIGVGAACIGVSERFPAGTDWVRPGTWTAAATIFTLSFVTLTAFAIEGWLAPRTKRRPAAATVLSVAALAAGLGAAGLVWWLGIAREGGGWVERSFLWPPSGRTAVRLFTLMFGLAPALLPAGVAVAVAIRREEGVSSGMSSLGWLLQGAGLGGLAGAFAIRLTGKPDAALFAAAIPLLAVGGIAAMLPQGASSVGGAVAQNAAQRGGPLLRYVLIAWLAAAAALLATVAPEVTIRADAPGAHAASDRTAALMIVSAGLGLLAAASRKPPADSGPDAFAGVYLSTAAIVTVALALSPAGLARSASGMLSGLMLGAAVACLAFALGRVVRQLRQSSGIAALDRLVLLGAILASAGSAVLLGLQVHGRWPSGFVLLASVVLSLTFLAGLEVIHGSFAPASRRSRLALIVTCLILAVVTLTAAGRQGSARAALPGHAARPVVSR